MDLQTNQILMMKKGISVALVVVGIIFLIMGVSAMESFQSDVSRFFTGTPTDRALWLLAGGAAATIIGAYGLLSGSKDE